jgi:hypothetical protein
MLLAGSALAACATGRTAAPSSRSISPGDTVPAASTGPSTSVPDRPPASDRARPPSARPTPATPPPAGTGVTGVTVLGPVCPLQRAERPCPDRPVAARLAVLGAKADSPVTTVDSGADGHFTVALAAGQYLLRAVSVAGAPPHSPTLVSIAVEPGRYTTVTVRFDSGIR